MWVFVSSWKLNSSFAANTKQMAADNAFKTQEKSEKSGWVKAIGRNGVGVSTDGGLKENKKSGA